MQICLFTELLHKLNQQMAKIHFTLIHAVVWRQEVAVMCFLICFATQVAHNVQRLVLGITRKQHKQSPVNTASTSPLSHLHLELCWV